MSHVDMASLPLTMREKVDAVKRELRLAHEDRVSAAEVDSLLRRVGLNLRPDLMRYVFSVLGDEAGVATAQGVFDGRCLWRFAEMFPALLESLYTRLLDIESDDSQQNAIQIAQDEISRLQTSREHLLSNIDRTDKALHASQLSLDECEKQIDVAIQREQNVQEQIQRAFSDKDTLAAHVSERKGGVEQHRGEELRRGRAVQDAQKALKETLSEQDKAMREADEAALLVDSLARQLDRAKDDHAKKCDAVTATEAKVASARERELTATHDLEEIEGPHIGAVDDLTQAEKELYDSLADIKRLQISAAQLLHETESQRRSRDAARAEHASARDLLETYKEELNLLDSQTRQKERTLSAMEAKNEEWRRRRKTVADEDLGILQKEIALRAERKDMEQEETDFRQRVADVTNVPGRRAAFAELNVNHDAHKHEQRIKATTTTTTTPPPQPHVGRPLIASPPRPGEAELHHPLDVAAMRGFDSTHFVQPSQSGNVQNTPMVALHNKGMQSHAKAKSPDRIAHPAITGEMWRHSVESQLPPQSAPHLHYPHPTHHNSVSTIPIGSSSPPPEPNPLHMLSAAATGPINMGSVSTHPIRASTTEHSAPAPLPPPPPPPPPPGYSSDANTSSVRTTTIQPMDLPTAKVSPRRTPKSVLGIRKKYFAMDAPGQRSPPPPPPPPPPQTRDISPLPSPPPPSRPLDEYGIESPGEKILREHEGDFIEAQMLKQQARAEVAAAVAASSGLQRLQANRYIYEDAMQDRATYTSTHPFAVKKALRERGVTRVVPNATPPSPPVLYNQPSKYQTAMQNRKKQRTEMKQQREHEDRMRVRAERTASRKRAPRVSEQPCYLRSTSGGVGSGVAGTKRVQVTL